MLIKCTDFAVRSLLMETGYLILFGCGVGLMAFLIWMLYPLHFREKREDAIQGYCPICTTGLRKKSGEQLRSDQLEIGDYEVQTRIKGCPYCLGQLDKRKRRCPVCKKKLSIDDVILALSDPRVDRNKLVIRGCANCFPQGF